MAAPSDIRERQRVLVRWQHRKPGEHDTYAGRVLEILGEFGRGGRFVQTTAHILYEANGLRLWHKPSELSPLAEDAVVAPPPVEADDDEPYMRQNPWRLLSLRCCYSLARLTDPARCLACSHPPCCNYDALAASLQASRACPVAGCAVTNMRSRDIVRDSALRGAIARLPLSAEACWLRGQADVQLEAPDAPKDAASRVSATSSFMTVAASPAVPLRRRRADETVDALRNVRSRRSEDRAETAELPRGRKAAEATGCQQAPVELEDDEGASEASDATELCRSRILEPPPTAGIPGCQPLESSSWHPGHPGSHSNTLVSFVLPLLTKLSSVENSIHGL